MIICLFLIGQFRRIVPCTRNIIHCHAVIGYKGIFAQSHNILAAVLLNCIGRLNLRRICTLICICIFFGICVILLLGCILEIDVPVLGFAIQLFQFGYRNGNGFCRSDNLILCILRIQGKDDVVIILEILIDFLLDLDSCGQKALVFVVIIRPDLRQAVRQHNLVREGQLIHPVVLIGTEVRAVHCPMVNIVIRCNATHTVPSRVDVRCRNGAFFGVALPIKTDREAVVLSEFCITVFRCSGGFTDTLLYIVLIVDDMHTCAGLQMLCGIVEYLISPIVPAIIVMVIGPGIILICERPIRLFLISTGICTHHASSVSGFAHGHIRMCCSNRLIHAVETPGNFKHSLCGRIRLVIPCAVVRRLCRFAVIVDSLILVDVDGHNYLFYRIFRFFSVIALRLFIIVGIVLREHICVTAQQIQPCKASVCIALVGFIENFLSGTDALGTVCIDCRNGFDIVLGTRINFQIVRIESIRRQIQCNIHSCRRIQRRISHVVIRLVFLSGKGRICLGQIVPCVQILAEVHSERTDGFIADLQLGVIRTISPLLFFREQITVCAVYMLIASPGASRHIFCGLGILLPQMLHRTGCCSVLLVSGTGILIKCHNSGVKIHLGDIDCCGVVFRDDIFFLVI